MSQTQQLKKYEGSEKISILVEIKDPVAVGFYKAMPEGLRPVYAEVLLTGAAYLASQKDFTSESIRVIESAAREVKENAADELEAATTKFFKENAPKILEEVTREWVEKLPNPKDYPDPEQYQKALKTALELLKETAELRGVEKIAQRTTEKGRFLEEETYESLADRYGNEYDVDDVRNVVGAVPHSKLGDYVLRCPSYKIAIDTTEEDLKESDARKKVDGTMRNREADGAVLIFRSFDLVPNKKMMVKVGHNKFFAYFGSHGEGTWDIAIDVLIALVETQKRAEERVEVDIAAQVASRVDKMLEIVADLDRDLEKDVEERAKKVESAAAKIQDATRSIRVEKLSAVREMAEMLLTIAKGQQHIGNI